VVKDDYTITFSLKSPQAAFLYNLARQGSVIYPREAVEKRTRGHGAIHPGGMGARGPHRPGSQCRVSRQGTAASRSRDLSLHSDPNAALSALKAGDADAAMFGIGPEHVSELQKDPRFQVIIGETTNDVILAMNKLAETLRGRSSAPGHDPRHQQGRGGQGGDVQPRPRPRLERRSAQSLLTITPVCRCGPSTCPASCRTTAPRPGSSSPRPAIPTASMRS
jgi:hypothetical protein